MASARRRTPADDRLEAAAGLFKALGHPARLLIINLLRAQPRHGEELAAILRINPATISHHLGKLAAAGMIRSRRDQYYQTYSVVPGVLDHSLGDLLSRVPSAAAPGVDEDAFRRKVLRTFFRRGQLVQIPAQRKKRRIILEQLVEEFEPGRIYDEREVNRTLVEFHEDVATLRRELVAHRLMTRARGQYRRVAAPSPADAVSSPGRQPRGPT